MRTQTMTVETRFGWALLIAGVMGLMTGCDSGGDEASPPEPVVAVLIGTATVDRVEDTLTAVGTIEANERVELKPEVAGTVQAIRFVEGQRVQKGDVLFELDAGKEEAELAQARAEVKLARSNLDRARPLAGTKAISQQEVDTLASILAVKSALLKVQEESLEDRAVTAPFDGQVGARRVSPGQYVNAGTLLGTLVDDATVKVVCGIPERGLAHVRVGQTGRLWVNAYPDLTFAGRVDLISPEVDEATRTVEVRLVAENPDGLLKAGMFTRIAIVVAVREQALIIPEGALVPSLDQFSVFAVTEGRAHVRPVKLGVRLPGKVEVQEGLGVEDELVLSGTQKLVEGMRVSSGSTADTTVAGEAGVGGEPAREGK